MTLPIRQRLVVWYVAMLAAIVASLSLFLLVRLRADLVSGVDASLDARAAQISLGYEGEFQDVSDATLVKLPQGEHGAQLLSSSGQVIESSGDRAARTPMIDPGLVHQVLAGQHVRTTVDLGPDRESFRVLALPAPTTPATEVMVVATSLEAVEGSVHRLLVLLLTAGPVVLLIAALIGWWLARKALSPVARMSEQASRIGIDQLDERIPVGPAVDELSQLGRTLNAMLDRLERGVEEKRRFVSDASHELRTPLSVMRSELEVSIRSDSLSPEARDVLESAAEEVERMRHVVEDMLTLARIDEGELRLLKAPVDLEEVAASVVGSIRPLAERKGVHVRMGGDAVRVSADRERLAQAVTNLVDNAVKYSDPGDTVEIAVWARGREAGITVSDSGPGIPAEVLPRVFERFVRVDPSRSRGEGGSGLGLAICRDLVLAHGGRVWGQSEPGRGSSFSLAIPAADERTSVPEPLPAGSDRR
jgi:heavy metal sensor kinase